MSRYLVDYYETYSKNYEVVANSKEEAEEKVIRGIQEGMFAEPDTCTDSWCEVKKVEENNMRYTTEELRNCLEKRLKWYQEALGYKEKGQFPPIGFVLPDGNFKSWEGAARELKNTLNMMK